MKRMTTTKQISDVLSNNLLQVVVIAYLRANDGVSEKEIEKILEIREE